MCSKNLKNEILKGTTESILKKLQKREEECSYLKSHKQQLEKTVEELTDRITSDEQTILILREEIKTRDTQISFMRKHFRNINKEVPVPLKNRPEYQEMIDLFANLEQMLSELLWENHKLKLRLDINQQQVAAVGIKNIVTEVSKAKQLARDVKNILLNPHGNPRLIFTNQPSQPCTFENGSLASDLEHLHSDLLDIKAKATDMFAEFYGKTCLTQ